MKTIQATLMIVLLTATALAGCTSKTPANGAGAPDSLPSAGTSATATAAHADAWRAPFPEPSKPTAITGSGATFPKPLLEAWSTEFADVDSKVRVSYAGGGSGKGISDITAKNVVFAGSDAPMQPKERGAAPDILHIPETLGLVAVVYNVEGVPSGLRLTGDVVGQIFLGTIQRWNDAKIADLNPGVALPEKPITCFVRSDSSGTTFTFTDYLWRTGDAWANAMGSAATKSPDWTKSTANVQKANGNDQVGGSVRQTGNSIGYVELAFVKALKLNAAQLKNKAGEWVAPTTDGAAKAAAAAAGALPDPAGDWSKVSISNADGSGSYPVSTFTYMLVFAKLSDYGGKWNADQMNAFRNWLWWGLHDGQADAGELGYAPLPAGVVAIGEHALGSIQV